MIAMDANHVGELLDAIGLKRRLVGGRIRVGARRPAAFRICIYAPEAHLFPQADALLIAGIGKGRMMRIVRTANEIHAALPDKPDIAGRTAVGVWHLPICMVLVGIAPLKPQTLTIQ